MRKRVRIWMAPLVMAILTIWASGVTFGELKADEDDGETSCYAEPLDCVDWAGGSCEGFCAKGVAPMLATCCWVFPE